MRKSQYDALQTWQHRKDAGEPADAFVVHKAYPTDISTVGDASARTRGFTISMGTPDRDKDTVAVNGWQLDNYRNNPVILFAHDYHSLPVGKSLEVSVQGDRLRSVAQFVERDIYPFADTVLQLLDGGYLNATSVGFDPLEWAPSKERTGGGWYEPVDFKRQELLEYSIVPVPAHPDALIDAKSKGIDISPIRQWAERALDEWSEEKGLYLPRSVVERALRVVDTKTVHGGVDLPAGSIQDIGTVTLPEAKAMDLDALLTRFKALEAQVAELKSGKVLSGVNAESIQQAHAHASKAMDHLQAVMDKGGVEPVTPDNSDPEKQIEPAADLTAVLSDLQTFVTQEFTRQYAAQTGRLP